MGSRLSIRVQLYLALATALAAGMVPNLLIASVVLQRSREVQARHGLDAAAAALARGVAAACEDRGPECVAAHASASATPELEVRYVPDWRGPGERGAAAVPVPGQPGALLISSAVTDIANAKPLMAAYSLLSSFLTLLLGAFLLNRVIVRPLDRLASAAERVGRLELDDPLAGEVPTLGRLGVAFERMTVSLKEERVRVAAQIAELEHLNRQLGEARDSLVRSEKLATVGRLAAGVAHEIGNPLGAILGYLELAKDKATPEAAEHLAHIDREIARIDRTVRELLDFSRPGPQDAALVPIPVRQAVEAAVRLASVQKRLKHVEFEVSIADGLAIVADAHHLSQVLVNVLLNAGDAMKGQGRIEIRANRLAAPPARRASDSPPAPRVELSLADSGPGIQASDLPRVFDPFFTTKEPGEGTGLGLAICHRIMETFGGEIRAGNRLQGGAVFTLVFREANSG